MNDFYFQFTQFYSEGREVPSDSTISNVLRGKQTALELNVVTVALTTSVICV